MAPEDSREATPAGGPAGAAEGSAEQEYLPFGRYLSRAREARGLSLDDLAHQTKVRRSIIEALEHGAKRELPEKVFVLGYVRSYATAVGLNVDEAVQRCSLAWDEEGIPADEIEGAGKSRLVEWIWPAVAAVCGAGAIWFIIRLH